jgi:hypothetical protein
LTKPIAGARRCAIQTSDSNVFQMIKVARQPNDHALNRAARLHEQQRRAFELTCQLIDHAVQNCDLALRMARPEWIGRSELGARRLYAKIALFWTVNVPIEYREELQFRSDRLKDAVRRLQSFQEIMRSQNPTTDPASNTPAPAATVAAADIRIAPQQDKSDAPGVIEFPRDRNPVRRTKKRKAGGSSRILTLSVR